MKCKQEEFVPQPHRHPGQVLGCPECLRERTYADATLDRSAAVNLARNIVERDVGAAITPKGQMTLAKAVLAMDETMRKIAARSTGDVDEGR